MCYHKKVMTNLVIGFGLRILQAYTLKVQRVLVSKFLTTTTLDDRGKGIQSAQ